MGRQLNKPILKDLSFQCNKFISFGSKKLLTKIGVLTKKKFSASAL